MSDALSKLKLAELKAKCKENGIKNYSKLNKAQLIDLLQGSPGVKAPVSAKPADKSPQQGKGDGHQASADPVAAVEAPRRNIQSTERPSSNTARQNSKSRSEQRPSGAQIKISPQNPLPPVTSAQTTAQISVEAAVSAISADLAQQNGLKRSGHCKLVSEDKAAQPSPKKTKTASLPVSNCGVVVPARSVIKPQVVTGLLARRGTPIADDAEVRRPAPKPKARKIQLKPVLRSTSTTSFEAGKVSRTVLPTSTSRGLDGCQTASAQEAWLRNSFLPIGLVDAAIGGPGFAVAVRFVISRMCIQGSHVKVDKVERISSDIWRLFSGDQAMYVLEQTGESLGESLRADWRNFATDGGDLYRLVKTKDGHEFPEGIARNFKGDRALARRIVLAGCVGESFCGPKLRLNQMDCEWLGRVAAQPPMKPSSVFTFAAASAVPSVQPAQDAETTPAQSHRVQLYLPEQKQVVSVHVDCHPDVAIVQRSSGQTDCVLRETGQVIGDENGPDELWTEVLHARQQTTSSEPL